MVAVRRVERMQPGTRASKRVALALVGLLASSLPCRIYGQEPAGAELAKKLANPISDLVSVPFQFNWEQGVGPEDQTRFILNIQPVMPFALNEALNLIARVITPLVSQPALFAGGSPTFGFVDGKRH